jgi:hypothetical protein
MPGFQSMSAKMDRIRLHSFLFLLVGLALILQLPGEAARAAALPTSSVSITLNNPSCVQQNPASGMCSIQFDSLSASGSDPSFSRVELLADGKLRAYMAGFFETSAYMSYSMFPGGLQVACGAPGAGGSSGFGKAYSITANAYMADGSSSSDSANVLCPAFDGKTYAPLIRKN